MKPVTRQLIAALLCAFGTGAKAEVVDKYHITPAEKAACQEDAVNLCSEAQQDEDSLVACMKQNVTKLTPICLKTFKAGLAKRHMT